MKMRPLILDEEAISKIKAMVAHAEANIFTMDDLLDIYNNQGTIPGDMKEFTCHLQNGYRIVFSIEQQNPGNIRHLSMSVDEDEMLPNELAVRAIMKEIGFVSELEDCFIKLEDISPNRQAINVLEIIQQ